MYYMYEYIINLFIYIMYVCNKDNNYLKINAYFIY